MQIVLSISVTASPLPVACPRVAKEHAYPAPVAAPIKDEASPAPVARPITTSLSDIDKAMTQLVQSWVDYSEAYSKIHGCGPELDGMAGEKWILLGDRLRYAVSSLQYDSMFDDYYGRS